MSKNENCDASELFLTSKRIELYKCLWDSYSEVRFQSNERNCKIQSWEIQNDARFKKYVELEKIANIFCKDIIHQSFNFFFWICNHSKNTKIIKIS